MSTLLEYRGTSLEFRRLASNMLKTDCEEGNLHLIRLRMFIQENELVNKIITRKITGIEYNYKDNFIINDGGWSSLNIPLKDTEHIKAMYDYLVDITPKKEELIGRASNFYNSSNKLNDIIRNYLEKLFKPLVDFIIDTLSMEMMILGPERTETHIHQNIETNYGSANIAQGNIKSVNSINETQVKDIIDLIVETRKMIESKEMDADQELKDEVIDDLETIQEQVKSKEPKVIKLKKAYQGINNFIKKIPQGIIQATQIISNLTDLNEKVNKLFQ